MPFAISKTLFEVTTETSLVQCWTIKSRETFMKKETDDDICDAVKGHMKPPHPEEKARGPSKSSWDIATL